MAGLESIAGIYDPLAKREESRELVCGSSGDAAASCIPSEQPAPGIPVTCIRFERLPLQSWRDSDTVTALSAFLKSPAANGIEMVICKDGFSLQFLPGLRPDGDPERWQAAQRATGLLSAAMEDLQELKRLDKLKASHA
jgi:hypothetical protein